MYRLYLNAGICVSETLLVQKKQVAEHQDATEHVGIPQHVWCREMAINQWHYSIKPKKYSSSLPKNGGQIKMMPPTNACHARVFLIWWVMGKGRRGLVVPAQHKSQHTNTGTCGENVLKMLGGHGVSLGGRWVAGTLSVHCLHVRGTCTATS